MISQYDILASVVEEKEIGKEEDRYQCSVDTQTGAGKMAQQVKSMLHKCEHLRSDPSSCIKSQM